MQLDVPGNLEQAGDDGGNPCQHQQAGGHLRAWVHILTFSVGGGGGRIRMFFLEG